MLDLYPELQNRARASAAVRPLDNIEPSFAEDFGAAFREGVRLRQSFSEQGLRFEIMQERIDRFKEVTGQNLPNPEGSSPRDRDAARRAVQQRFDQLALERPDIDLKLPTEEELNAEAVSRATDALRDRRAVEARQRPFVPFFGTLGSFLGDTTAALTDPINTVSMAFGASRSAGILQTALVEAGVVSVSESAIQAATFDFRSEVDPEFSVAQAAGEVGIAATGAFLIGGTIKTLASAYNAARARGRTAELPRHAKDAGNVTLRAAANGQTPHARTAPNQAKHNRAINKAAEDLVAGRPVAIPEDAFLAQTDRPGRIYDSDGRSVPVRYEVVEAADLVPSHTRELGLNPDFPQELQPRQRDRPISQDQINNISKRLQPERLGPSVQSDSGTPIIGPDDIVESGNARVLALQRVYERGGVNADNYRSFLRSQGHDIDDFSAPVLVARRLNSMDAQERVRFVNAANRSTAMRLSTTEQAFADARLIDDPLLNSLRGADIGTLRNRNFVRGFMSKLSRSEQGGLVDARGVLSQEGERRLTAALLARAFGDAGVLARTLEDANSNIRAIGGALADVAPVWARLRDAVARGEVPAGMDITDDIMDAVRAVMRARDAGRPLREFLDQAEIFGGTSEVAKVIARFLFRDADMRQPVSRKAFGEMLQEYAEEARKNVAGARLLGDPLDQQEILDAVLRGRSRLDIADDFGGLDERAVGSPVGNDLLDEATAPERVATRMTEDEIDDEVLRELDALRAERDIQVQVTREGDDGQQIVETRSLDDMLDEIDTEIEAANRIETCIVGGQEG